MGRGKALSDYERGQIDELINAGQSDADIAVQIGRSTNMVHNCRLRGPEKPPGNWMTGMFALLWTRRLSPARRQAPSSQFSAWKSQKGRY
jgi:hypothetical protein